MVIFEYLERRRHELRELAIQLTLAHINLAVSKHLRWRITSTEGTKDIG